MSRPEPTSPHYYVGIDVGTASVRAALVDQDGSVVLTAKEPIEIWEPHPNHYVQSSSDIWDKCCRTARRVTQGVDPSQIRGIGFDATCSLVVLDKSFQPLPVNSNGEKDRNVILWMDHRAFGQAEQISRTRHRVLQYVGGVMSPEMQPPKLMWLKENLRESCWEKAGHFLDLPDFLSWKATGSLTRSLCTLICKWTYSSETGWDDSFWTTIGLEDLVSDYSKIGVQVSSPGAPLGAGLSGEAARELGMCEGTAVAASLIDAHAGGLGVVGVDMTGHNLRCETQPITSRLALICGTSSCHMAISERPLFVPGVWGPYYSAMVPGLWLNEGGQSATGKLLDRIIKGHAAFPELQKKAKESSENIYTFLNRHLEAIKKESALGLLTADLHVWPDFHGNRSPLADPALKGMVVGLTLSQTLDDLARLYLATVQAVALGTRHILDSLQAAGHRISTLCMCGGLSKNLLFVQMHADITGLPVVLSREVESVLVGAAILGACASGDFHSIQEAMGRMAGAGKIIESNPEHSSFYDKKYKVFRRLVELQKECRALMQD
ncbi:FGGY carbohydrate kinase domain-containing protein [Polyodon spathula]|uniref:FGGY carbohydrate kinase domain-containing protein n=1 Tax=Polyodon spathula TaxID=7913 RepID=UPI001B7ED92D|nr:FGGY carbohydrate kinase domain-containing protein [Polyodon spathula]